MEKYEQKILKEFISMPYPEILNHQFEITNDYLSGYVSRFLLGERFDFEFNSFTKEEANYINSLITKNINNTNGKDLLTFFLMVKLVCNILNKYKQTQ